MDGSTAEAWRRRVVQKIDWVRPVHGTVIAAAEARKSDKPLLPKAGLFTRYDSRRCFVCLTHESLMLLQAPPIYPGTMMSWWMLKKPIDQVSSAGVEIDQVVEDSKGNVSLRMRWPGREPFYMTFGPGWRDEATAMIRALRSGPAPGAGPDTP